MKMNRIHHNFEMCAVTNSNSQTTFTKWHIQTKVANTNIDIYMCLETENLEGDGEWVWSFGLVRFKYSESLKCVQGAVRYNQSFYVYQIFHFKTEKCIEFIRSPFLAKLNITKFYRQSITEKFLNIWIRFENDRQAFRDYCQCSGAIRLFNCIPIQWIHFIKNIDEKFIVIFFGEIITLTFPIEKL